VKSKVKAVSLISIDPQKDGFSGVLIGWESGRLEVILLIKLRVLIFGIFSD